MLSRVLEVLSKFRAKLQDRFSCGIEPSNKLGDTNRTLKSCTLLAEKELEICIPLRKARCGIPRGVSIAIAQDGDEENVIWPRD